MVAAFGQWFDVVDKVRGDIPSVFKAALAKRMGFPVSCAYLLPVLSISFADVVSAREVVVLCVHNLRVFLAVNSIGKQRTAGVAAGASWHSWQCKHLVYGIKKAPVKFRCFLFCLTSGFLFRQFLVDLVNAFLNHVGQAKSGKPTAFRQLLVFALGEPETHNAVLGVIGRSSHFLAVNFYHILT